ncbi:hypothetical protein M2282_003407 [Variovorax boronicumulans]|uniref:MFS transporter n=1 Tax=Variovorax boronicumulans TaxID=436515 RepID=UPI00247412F5|nr:MFS transporter [Variovorax boronicumulans]MDH6168256.1 hypothetical protein [Variovorax boronicumulans]
MFEGANLLAGDKRKYGQQAAMEIAGDIHEYTELYSPEESIGVPYLNGRQVFDFNEHFIELGTATEGRSFFFMLLGLSAFVSIATFGGWLYSVFSTYGPSDPPRWAFIAFMTLPMAGAACISSLLWRILLRSVFLTALTARYRFNRTTGKVYVLRPKRFGGNAVLDWHRVKAHPRWCTPLEVKPGWQYNERERDKRKRAGGGFSMRRGLVLYWPPLDANDPERKGEDILWVGCWLSGTPLWEYIRAFMQEGMQAVPAPEPHEYRRKRRSSMWQYLWEEGFDATIREARLMGHEKPESAVGVGDWLREGPFVMFNSWAQWLCWWPTFPKEWNSDCGQKRREHGIGAEEPLRWKAKA